jgi:hypothetical protein
MAIYYALGNALVSNDEMRSKIADGRLQKFPSDNDMKFREKAMDFADRLRGIDKAHSLI